MLFEWFCLRKRRYFPNCPLTSISYSSRALSNYQCGFAMIITWCMFFTIINNSNNNILHFWSTFHLPTSVLFCKQLIRHQNTVSGVIPTFLQGSARGQTMLPLSRQSMVLERMSRNPHEYALWINMPWGKFSYLFQLISSWPNKWKGQKFQTVPCNRILKSFNLVMWQWYSWQRQSFSRWLHMPEKFKES